MNKPVELTGMIGRWVLIGALAAAPVFFLPLTQDFYDPNKWLLLIAAALAVVLLAGIRLGLRGEVILSVSPLSVGLACLTTAALISLFTASTNRWEAILLPLGAGTFLALTITVSLGSHALGVVGRQWLRWLLTSVGAVAGVIAILQSLRIGKILFPSVPFLADPLWTPLGSSVGLVGLLLLVLPLAVDTAAEGMGTGEKKAIRPEAFAAGIAVCLMAAGVLVTLWNIVPIFSRSFLPIPSAWAVMLEVLKNPRQAATGVGLENFLAAFTAGRPVSLNLGNLWNVRFGLSATFLFHIVTSMGFMGLGAVLLFLKAMWPAGKAITGITVSRFLSIAVLLLLPPNLTILTVIVALLLATHTPSEKEEIVLKLPNQLNILHTGALVLTLAIVGFVVYVVGRAYAAELTFYRSLLAANQNKGTDTYNLQIKTIQFNPYFARYRITYSRTNLALAQAITRGPAGQDAATPRTLSETERSTVMTLIQQAIREAKMAVNLAPNNVFAWENLANVYQSLVGVAQGADTWAVAATQRGIQLDPTNPVLRLSLGGLYVAGNNHEDAIQQFLLSANLKPNWANAYYNLASAYRLNGNTDRAIAALNTTLSLLKPDTTDYTRAKNELEELEKKKAATTPAPQPGSGTPESSLTQPPSSEPIVVPPLSLPESEGPDTGLPQPASPAGGSGNAE